MLNHYKGRFTYTELINLPMRDFHTFYYFMYVDSLTGETNTGLEDELEELVDG